VDDELSAYDFQTVLSEHRHQSYAPFPLFRQALTEAVRKVHADAPVMELELTDLQRRLGTTNEKAGDFERAELVGHRLSNLMCIVLLSRDL
jgi:hypothetical protein